MNKGFAPLIPFAVIAIIAVGGYLFYSSLQPDAQKAFQYSQKSVPLSITGFTTLSLSDASFSTDDPSDPFWNKKVWIMTVAQGGLAQNARGTITKQQIEDRSDVQPESDFEIDITYSKQSCEYAIKQNYQTPQLYKYEYHGFTWIIGDLKQYCQDTYPNTKWYGKWAASFEGFCIEEIKQTGAVAYNTIENPSVHTVSTIEVSNGEDTSSATIDTKGDIKKQIGDNVYVVWNGYLARDACESQSAYYGFYKDGSWKLGWESNYETYKTQYDIFIRTIDNIASNGWVTSKESAINAIQLVNSAATNAQQTQQFGQIDKVNSLTDALIIQDLHSFVSIPVYTFFVKADWLGIYQPVAKPQILEVSSQTFKAGSEGTIYTRFKNIGDGRGTFSVWAECSSPFQQVGTTMDFTLQPDETETANIRITADANQPTTKSCTVHVKVLTYEATKSVSVSVDPHQVCEPDRYYCEDNIAKKCNEFGSALVNVEDCGADKVCVYSPDGTSKCELSGQCTFDWDCDDGNLCTIDSCQEGLAGKKCIHSAISGCDPGDFTEEDKCYLACDADVDPLDVFQVGKYQCYGGCWVEFNWWIIIIGFAAAVLAVFAIVSLFKFTPGMFQLVMFVLVLVLTVFASFWIGIIVIIVSIIILMRG